MKKASKVLSIFMFPIIVFVLHSLSVRILNLWAVFPNLDIPFHYFGGLCSRPYSVLYGKGEADSHFPICMDP